MDSPDQRVALLLQRQLEHESLFNTDLYLAQKLQEDFNKEVTSENPTALVYDHKTKATDDTRSLVDPSWELIDPTPNIHNLFVAFNLRFFWNKLLAVCVSWSKKMTSCAGVCSYQGRGGMCTITLSEPLLKLRPRKDLVETLLHEMIHAYLFVTHNNRDRDGHGPEFHKHMFRINKEAGTNITVYHSFHDEVRLYQQHWWRCNGPCQTRKPYFGMVRRATNRAPGPYDRWWSEHARTCGGTFIKVKEPEKKSTTSAKSRNGVTTILNKGFGDIRNFVTVTSKSNTSDIHEQTNINNTMQNNSIKMPIVGASNIHGYTNLSTPANNVVKQVSNGNMMRTGVTTGGMKTKSNSNSTIVVNKKSNITSDSVTNIDATKTEIKIFSGSGKSLISSSSAKVRTDDYSVVRNHWANKFPPSPTKLNKRSVIELSPSKISKKQKTDKECSVKIKFKLQIQ
ncbi:hypothetical protein MML48_1g18655 [Holotrichia oblita]|uniref:Uncharacterized protein n=1 Tax=Holotrichia oblita TaxID=644536 RepID=A0ACB9TTH3_HOLOL|nr:hypothetical protein MML48_1g18655 [Holotrichia oblita]